MKVERHYDDEALLACLQKSPLGSDAHLTSCTDCSEKLETFQMITDALHEHDVWDTQEVRRDPVPDTIANLRAFADRMAFEDTQAEAYVRELLAGSREEWMPRLMEHPEWRTAGVVRRLVGATDHAIDTNPPNAVAITALATEIADQLQITHASETVHRLQGAAWRERAYALFFTGDFLNAERATERAEDAFDKCGVAEYDRARVGIVQALVLRAFERLDEAAVAASSGADVFSRFGDIRRTVTARMAEVRLLISRANYSCAVAILENLESHVRHGADADLHAHVQGNLGYATWKAGQRATAIGHFEIASAIFDALGSTTEAVRIRWNVAAILAEDGRLLDAKERLQGVIGEFDMLAMTSEYALASLDLAELFLAESKFDAVEEICYAAMRSFERAGVAYTTRAVTALGYIREAARQRIANQNMVRHVRDYIRRLPSEPALQFAEITP